MPEICCRRTIERGGNRNKRTAESSARAPRGELRDSKTVAHHANDQIHRQQVCAQCVPEIQPAQSHDQGIRFSLMHEITTQELNV